MEALPFLQDLLLVFAVAGVVVFLFHHLRLPVVVGLLVAGMVVGPSGLSLVRETESVAVLAEIGVVVLLFAVGLEFSLTELFGMWRLMLKIGVPQVLISGIGAFVATIWYLGRWEPALFVGMLVAMSSTAVVLKMLSDRGELGAAHGRIAVAVLLLQDLLVVVFMMLVPLLAHAEGRLPWYLTLLQGAGVVVIVLLAGRYVIPWIVSGVARTRNRELFLILVLLLCLGTAALTAALGMSLALGAFLAGLALAETEYGHQTIAEVLPFRDTLASIFFISVGMLLDQSFVAQHWLIVLMSVVALVALKFVAAAVPTRLAGSPMRVALLSGIALAQIGEFSFLLASQGNRYRLLREDDYQTFLAAAVLTIGATPFLIGGSSTLVGWFRGMRWLDGDRRRGTLPLPPPEEPPQKNHVIIIGYGVNGRNLARVLRDVDIPYVILEMNPETVRELRERSEPVLYGDCTRPSILARLGVQEAKVCVIAISDPISTRRAVRIARQLNPGLHIIVRTRFVVEVEELRHLGANEIIPADFETSVEIFARVLAEYEVPRNLVLDLIDRIRKAHYEVLRDPALPATRLELPHDVLNQVETESCLLREGSPALGRTIREVDLRAATGATVIAIRRGPRLLLNPEPSTPFEPGDIVVLIGDRPQIDRALLVLDPSLANQE